MLFFTHKAATGTRPVKEKIEKNRKKNKFSSGQVGERQ